MLHRFFIILLFSSCTSVAAVDKTGIPGDTISTSNTSTDQKALRRTAINLIGSPYKYGGSSPNGFDCSGFTSYIYKTVLNVPLNRSSAEQSKMGKSVKTDELEIGDLVFFKLTPKGKINHVAMVVDGTDGNMVVIHSTSSSGVIMQDILASNYWKSKIVFAKRIL
ncbi:MAG: C40 family peptidase [Saprospiraceae bacterium]|nr:C40 family peptidase [Saprospiraceae bacterium]